jgi:hypothetical protein
MRIVIFSALVFAAFVLPVAADFTGAGGGQILMKEKAEVVEGYKILTEDNRITALEEEFASLLQAVVERIRSESDPMKQESLQKEIHGLKENQLIAMVELHLEMALEKGDERLIAELEEVLHYFSVPEVIADPAVGERLIAPIAGAENPMAYRTDPDDVP